MAEAAADRPVPGPQLLDRWWGQEWAIRSGEQEGANRPQPSHLMLKLSPEATSGMTGWRRTVGISENNLKPWHDAARRDRESTIRLLCGEPHGSGPQPRARTGSTTHNRLPCIMPRVHAPFDQFER